MNTNKQKLLNTQKYRETPKGILTKKPNEVRERIVKLIGDVPRIELFARQEADGWDC